MTEVEIGGRRVPIRLRRNLRARRIILTIDGRAGSADDGVVVTLPRGVAKAEAMSLVAEKAEWIGDALARLPPRVAFADGAAIPILGIPRTIRHRPDSRLGVRLLADEIWVSGAAEHLPRRVGDWLKAEARRLIRPRAEVMADRVGRGISRLSVRDMRSRWGSCSGSGNLSFCWRVVMAPEPVLDYVVAHEVAHMVEHNHGRRFWAQVDALGVDAEGGREWLRVHGERLMRIG